MSISHLPPFSGQGLWACSTCGSIRTARFCTRCGEKVERDRKTWFSLVGAPGETMMNRRSQVLNRFPGVANIEADRYVLHADGLPHLRWIADNLGQMPGGKQVRVVGPGGWGMQVKEPVCQCLLATVSSSIRGCMTQKARPALCANLTAYLPLCEEMTTHSLADLLEMWGRKGDAELLVLGLLLEMDGGDVRRTCPLFGRALRFGVSDVERLALMMGHLVSRRRSGPIVLGGSNAREGRRVGVSGSARLESSGSGLWSEEGSGLFARWNSGLIHAAADKGYRSSISYVAPDGAVESLRPVSGKVDSAHCVGGDLVLGVHRPRGLRGIHVVHGGPEPGGLLTQTLPVTDADAFMGRSACLEVYGSTVRIASSDSEGVLRLVGWEGRRLPGARWNLLIADANHFLVWSDEGVALLLGRKRGWLLTSVAGEGRYPDASPETPHFSGVRQAVRLSSRRFAVLSAGGHCLSVMEFGQFPGMLEVPASCPSRYILPFPAQAMAGGDADLVFLHGAGYVYAVRLSTGQAVHWEPRADSMRGGVVTGGGWWRADDRLRFLLSRRAPSANRWSPTLADRLADMLTQKHGETHPIVDRLHRQPFKPSWGV